MIPRKLAFIAVIISSLGFGSVSPALADAGGSGYVGSQISVTQTKMAAAQTEMSEAEMKKEGAGEKTEVPTGTNIDKERAVEIARTQLKIPDEYVLQSAGYNTHYYMKRGVWSLYFAKQDQYRYYGSVNATIDADNGEIIQFYIQDNDPKNKATYPPKVDLQAAKRIAEQFIAEMSPAKQSEILYNDDMEKSFKPPLNGDVRYYLRYDRSVNGIPFAGNFISVTIDGNGSVVGYDYIWDADIQFENAEDAIGLEEAKNILRDPSNIILQYVTPYNGIKAAPILTYHYKIDRIDARTGDAVDYNGNIVDTSHDYKPLSDQPIAELPQGQLNLTSEQAITKFKEVAGLPENAKLQDASYQEYMNYGSKHMISSWNLSWNLPASEGDQMLYIWANVNSKTGEITNFNRGYNYNPSIEEKEPAVSKEQAQETAIEFIKKNTPYYMHQLSLDNSQLNEIPIEKMQNMPTYRIQFRRLINGILTESENVVFEVNKQTGEIVSYWGGISAHEYPQTAPEVLTLEQADALLGAQYDIKLQYFIENEYLYYMDSPMGASGETTEAAQVKTAKLIYQRVPKYTAEQVVLDAVSGVWRNRETGEITTRERLMATDIENHWARNELQIMLDYKALDLKDGKVNPGQNITRGEMIKMLIIAMNGGYYPHPYYEREASFADVGKESVYFPYVEAAVDRNLIERTQTFNPDAEMTRDELAEIIIKALGYNSLAQVDGIFSLEAKDKEQIVHKGHVSIAIGLGILTADKEGYFYPLRKATRAEAAVAFIRYLNKRSILQEYPVYHY